MLALVILPGMRKAGPGSERVLPMAQILQAMGIAALLTTIAGLLLYILLYRFSWAWITSSVGIGFTIGSLVGIVAFLLGQLSTGPTAKKIGQLAGQMQPAGAPPTGGWWWDARSPNTGWRCNCEAGPCANSAQAWITPRFRGIG